MKLSVQWLNDYVTIDASQDEWVQRLTMAGLEVEQTELIDGDVVFDIEITPNRPDCLNMVGLSREASAIFNQTLKKPKFKSVPSSKKKINIQIEEKDVCHRYIAAIIDDVKVSMSKDVLPKRLKSLGVSRINNVVDITNFCMMELGQPLHAFDYDKVEGSIVVRYAKKGERCLTLDDVDRELDSSMLVVADEKKVLAIAGVIGGKSSEVTSKTNRVLLESAYFEMGTVRRTAKKLGISTDSSYRFERGVLYDNVEDGSNRAIQLIEELADGNVVHRTDVVANKKRTSQKKVRVSHDQIKNLLGADIAFSKCKTILKRLEFDVSVNNDVLEVVAPAHRTDVFIAEDVIEELARIVGYDSLPVTMPYINSINITDKNTTLQVKSIVSDVCVSQGFNETITFSLISEDMFKHCYLDFEKAPTLQNSMSLEHSILRSSLLPSCLNIVALNLNHGQKDLKMFEMGRVYPADGELETLGLVVTSDKVDKFLDLKGVVDLVFDRLNISNVSFESTSSKAYKPGHVAVIKIGKSIQGIIGEVDSAVLKKFAIKKSKVFFAQFNIEDCVAKADLHKKFKELPEYPAVTRDVSLSVKQDIEYQDVQNICFELGGSILTEVNFIEEYRGEHVAKSFKGLVFSLVFQSYNKTLRDDEVTAVYDQIIDRLKKQLDASLR